MSEDGPSPKHDDAAHFKMIVGWGAGSKRSVTSTAELDECIDSLTSDPKLPLDSSSP